ncbi:CHASE2 domain-containing protein [Pseudanabaena sp. BC1403]|uniref:CHASE2 domain-containing protein n=1 Tax=Pseudanabaena sp. BC1403 TaxID=2043171 RepID=UPI0015E1670C|nr:CHASE2 domain-containing protein [Pseudanabaena sp. BC1403]
MQAIKTWLFPPQPKPQVFLNLLTTDNLRSPQAIKASLQVNRAEIAASSAKITKELTNDFAAWRENYPVYAVKLQNDAVNEEVDIENEKNFRKPQPTIDEETSGLKGEFSIEDAAERVERSINALFNSEEFREIRDQIIKLLPPKGQHQPDVYIRYDDPHLAELPLHLWNEFQDRDIEPVFSSKETKPQKFSDKKKHKPRILLILGDFIDIKNDNEKLNWQKEYSNADIKVLELLNEKGINNALLKEKWDVLYFGGHSTTEYGKGILYLKDGKRIVLDDFQRSLTTAAQNGLQLVILNSCNSLGAAHALQSAGVPMVVATRHLIHNSIAPEFLEYFLDSYLNIGQSLKDAVGHARYLLKSQHPEFPCASWLPVVFQSPSFAMQPKPSPLIAIVAASLTTILVAVIHISGGFQGAELSLYDTMMGFRNPQELDRRIVVVRVTPSDQEMQINEGRQLDHESISDKDLVRLLERLDQEMPKVIGMTFKRPNLRGDTTENRKLVERILSDKNPTLVLHCSTGDDLERGYFPEPMKPRSISITSKLGDPRIGFSNSLPDLEYSSKDRRLMLIQKTPKDDCGSLARLSFSLRVVMQFLGEANEAQVKFIQDKEQIILKYKNFEVAGIVEKQGGYQIDPSLDPDPEAQSFPKKLSILFNHKNYKSGKIKVLNFALDDVLSGRNSSLKDRIVLIGGFGEDSISINNLDYQALAVDYLLRIFEGEAILTGVINNISFCLYFVSILTISLIFVQIHVNSNSKQFIMIFTTFALYSFIVLLIYMLFLLKMSLWIPIIPILIGSTASCLVLSFVCFTFFTKTENSLTKIY